MFRRCNLKTLSALGPGLKRSLFVGVMSGAVFGAYDASVVLFRGAGAMAATGGLGLSGHVGFQCAVGGFSGLLVGTLWPVFRSSPWGAAALGFLVGAVAFSALAFPTEPVASWIDGLPWYLVLGGLVGAYGGYRLKQEVSENDAVSEAE
jgi:hypothetical protein